MILSRPVMTENEVDSEAGATWNSPAYGAVAREAGDRDGTERGRCGAADRTGRSPAPGAGQTPLPGRGPLDRGPGQGHADGAAWLHAGRGSAPARPAGPRIRDQRDRAGRPDHPAGTAGPRTGAGRAPGQ